MKFYHLKRDVSRKDQKDLFSADYNGTFFGLCPTVNSRLKFDEPRCYTRRPGIVVILAG